MEFEWDYEEMAVELLRERAAVMGELEKAEAWLNSMRGESNSMVYLSIIAALYNGECYGNWPWREFTIPEFLKRQAD